MNQSENRPNCYRDTEIRSYWLGQLPKVEEAQVEEGYFVDEGLFERVMTVKDELIDDYLFGRLTSYDRFCFESNFLNAPDHRQQVELINSLIDVLGKSPQPQIEKTPSWKFWAGLPARVQSFAWASAVILLLAAAAGTWLFKENRQMQQELTRIRADQQRRDEEWQKAIAVLRMQGGDVVTPSPPPSISPSAKTPVTPNMPPPIDDQSASIVFVSLIPNVMRSADVQGSGSSDNVTIKSSTQWVKLKLLLENPTAYRSYQAQLKDEVGKIVQHKSGLRPSASGSIKIEFPASLFDAGKYNLTLFGMNRKREPDPAADYSFSVVKN